MGFTKLDEGIVHSSVWSEPYPTRVLWVTMLAMCDSRGFVASSRSGLTRAANITQVEFDASIEILEGPDPDSRSPEHDGRRVEKRDGGWQVLNYQKYRNFSYSSSPEAVRQRKHRGRARPCDGSLHVTKGRDISASASASSSDLLNKFLKTISEDDRAGWKKAYPACDLDIEIAKALEWVKSNPAKGRKSNWRKFLTSWFSRSQDRGGTKRGTAGNRSDDFARLDAWANKEGK